MISLSFFGQNAHFAINLFAALAFFAVFWLYFDAASTKRSRKTIFKSVGFFFIAISFLLHGTVIEDSGFGESLLGNRVTLAAVLLKLVGFGVIIISELLDPLQKVPNTAKLSPSEFEITPNTQTDGDNIVIRPGKSFAAGTAGIGSLGGTLQMLLPISALAISVLYWRRATVGLERHLKPIALAFSILTVYEIVSLASLWRSSENPTLASLTAAFGPLWILEHVLVLIVAILFSVWVWRYLVQRFFSQIFMILLTVTLGVFLVTTTGFTLLLHNSVQDESITNLKTASSVLQYAIDSKKSETLANASSLSENPAYISAITSKDTTELARLASNFLEDKQISTMTITDFAGQVLLRAEDPSRYGDSLSSDTQIRRAILNQSSSNIVAANGVLAPLVSVKSTVPVIGSNNAVVGTITTGIVLDSAFVDGIENATGLNSSIYVGDVRSATTFQTPDETTRYIGVKDTNESVTRTVLQDGNPYSGIVSVLNRNFLSVYAPLKDIDNTTLGMLFIGVPEATIAQTAGKSVELTFILTAMLMVIMVFPAYLLSKYISKQLA